MLNTTRDARRGTGTQADVHANTRESNTREANAREAGSAGELRRTSPTHADAATPLLCECGHSNAADRKFCASCGANLWDTCPKCSTPQPRSGRFCGQCGLDVPGFYAERVAQGEENLRRARELVEACHFNEAVTALRSIRVTDHPRLAGLAREVAEALSSCTSERERRLAAARSAVEQAQHLFARFAYERAAELLREIPEPLRDEEAQRMLSESRARFTEVLRLSGEVREDLAAKRTLAAAPKLERLLKLRPDHDEAGRLLQQIERKVVEAAQKKIARQDHAGAAELIRQIGSDYHSPSAQEILAQASEVSWLVHQLENAPTASANLQRLADRLLRIAPGHAEYTALRTQIAQRRAADPNDSWLAAPAWRPEVAGRSCELSVHWLRGGRRLRIADSVRSIWNERPGQFAVACGLALQALDRAAVDLNLAPEEKSSLLGRLTGRRRRAPVERAWGIDVGPTALKAVRLRNDPASGDVHVEEAVFVETVGGVDAARDEADLFERGVATVQAFASGRRFENHRLAVNVPGLLSLSRWVELPNSLGKRIDEALIQEVRRQIALPLEELAWDHFDLTAAEQMSNGAMRRFLVVAAKQRVVQTRLKLAAPLSARIDVLQSDGVALHNFVRFEFGGSSDRAPVEPSLTDEAIALVDLGSDTTNLIMSGPDLLWFRAFGPGGDEATRALAKEFQIARAEAEQLKRDPASSPNLTRWSTALQPVVDGLYREIQRSQTQFRGLFPDRVPKALYCCGGGGPLLATLAPQHRDVDDLS